MKRPITLGTILTITLVVYFIGAFFMYINEYSYNEFWYADPKGIYMFSAMFGYLILTVGSFIGAIYLLTIKGLPKFIVRIWNYPVIK